MSASTRIEQFPSVHANVTNANPLVIPDDKLPGAINEALSLGNAFFHSQCLYAVCKLGVPDAIGADRLSSEEIQQKTTIKNGTALLRVLRFLSTKGVFTEHAHGGKCTFALSMMGALLQTKAPQPSIHCGILHWCEPAMWNAWAKIEQHLQQEESVDTFPFKLANGGTVFDYYSHSSASAGWFNDFMTFFSVPEVPIVIDHFHWAEFEHKTVVDVGGSLGVFMKALHEKYPSIKVISFDLPEVINSIDPKSAHGVEFVAGDMFEANSIPKCDAIFMKHILHDWDRADCNRILKSCWHALSAHGKVIICDAVLPSPGKRSAWNEHDLTTQQMSLDALMLVIGGRERTADEWRELAEDTGFALHNVKMTPTPNSQLITLERVQSGPSAA